MENLRIRCRSCGKELEGHPIKSISCGCPNMATIRADKISATDLSQVIMLNSFTSQNTNNYLTTQDLQFQEERKKRKVRKLDFEIR